MSIDEKDGSGGMLPQLYINNAKKSYNILIATDFTTPARGGIETHGYQLAQSLIQLGHKVIFVTNKFKFERTGIRHYDNGLKIYHIPWLPIINGNDTFFKCWRSIPVFRQIMIRERINIVHGHMSTSLINMESLFAAHLLGIKTVFTEHSLFNYADAASINLNKSIKFTKRDIDACIAVSAACKDNICLRAKIDPHRVFTIQNAVNTDLFVPTPDRTYIKSDKDTINVVYIARLQYRKGVDLLIGIIPDICAQFPNVNFIIGGDGDKMQILKDLQRKHQLYDRVELLGNLSHTQVCQALNRGHIFLNTSLTESFCMAILEAACCNLLVVSTNVGGVPEVLPNRMVYLSAPSCDALKDKLSQAIEDVPNVDTSDFHDELKQIYSWEEVARKTVKVYDFVMNTPYPSILSRIKSATAMGGIVWFMTYFYLIIEYVSLFLIDMFWPEEEIDILPDFDSVRYKEEGILNFGNHSFSVHGKSTSDLNLINPTTRNHLQTGQNDYLKPIRLLVGAKEKNIRSEIGSRSLRYETIRPDKVPEGQTKQKNANLRRISLKDKTVYDAKKDIFTPLDELDEQMRSEQEFDLIQNQAKYLEKLYNPFNQQKADLQNGPLKNGNQFATQSKSKSFLGFESLGLNNISNGFGSGMFASGMHGQSQAGGISSTFSNNPLMLNSMQQQQFQLQQQRLLRSGMYNFYKDRERKRNARATPYIPKC